MTTFFCIHCGLRKDLTVPTESTDNSVGIWSKLRSDGGSIMNDEVYIRCPECDQSRRYVREVSNGGGETA